MKNTLAKLPPWVFRSLILLIKRQMRSKTVSIPLRLKIMTNLFILSHGLQSTTQNATFDKEKLLWDLEQEKRVQNMRKVCKSYQTADFNLTSWLHAHFNHENLKNILVSDRYRTLYCYVPKAACTNWKRAFLILNGVVDNEKDALKLAHKPNTRLSLNMYSEEEALYRIQKYFKFIFVRNPRSRTLSVYKEKFAADRRWRFRWLIQTANSIHVQFGNHTSLRAPPVDGYNVSFEEFVRYLGTHNSRLHLKGGEHWQPMYDICHPCQMKYDIVGKFETFQSDAIQMLRVLNRTDLQKVLLRKSDHSTGSSSETVLREYYSKLTEKEKKGLIWRYRKDFEVFGYSPFEIWKKKKKKKKKKKGT